MLLDCPACKKQLYPSFINDIEIDICESGCKGIWFDDGELNKIQGLPSSPSYEEVEGIFVPKPVDLALSESKRTCPRCNIPLYRYNWAIKSDIYIDLCHVCFGTWLDFGELKGINEYQTMINDIKDQKEKKARLEEDCKKFDIKYPSIDAIKYEQSKVQQNQQHKADKLMHVISMLNFNTIFKK